MKQSALNNTVRSKNIKVLNCTFVKMISCTFILFLFLSQASFAQRTGNSYKTALGVKFYPTGVTFKTFVKSDVAFEAIGYFWDRGTRITGLYEYHNNLSDNGALKWYVGPGAHLGFYNKDYYNGGTSFGLDGVLGLDYKFPGIPFNISLDWQPSFEFGDFEGFSGNWGGIGVRFVL